MTRKDHLVFWGVLVPKHLDKKIREVIKAGYFASRSDFLREAARKLLEQIEKQQK